MPVPNELLNLPPVLYAAPLHGYRGEFKYYNGHTFEIQRDVTHDDFILGMLCLQNADIHRTLECGRLEMWLNVDEAVESPIQLFSSIKVGMLKQQREHLFSIDTSCVNSLGQARILVSRWLSRILHENQSSVMSTISLKHALAE